MAKATKQNIEAARRELNYIARTAQTLSDYEAVDAILRALDNVRLELDDIEADAQEGNAAGLLAA
jgi:hypothetical protein